MMEKKKITLIVSLTLISSICVGALLSVYFTFLHHYKGKIVKNDWSETDTFDIKKIKTIKKEKDKDFVILNLADIQICDLENFFNKETIHKEINYLVEKTHPDLITLTGDQTWSNENLMSTKSIISWLDSYKIPYAPVFGNHDYGNKPNSAVCDINYLCDLYESGKYSLFSRGPSNLGSIGNYVFNIVEENQIVKTVYMLNNGTVDSFTSEQMKWMKWTSEGIKAYNNDIYSSGMVFMHKPIPEFRTAYQHYLVDHSTSVGIPYINWSLSGVDGHQLFDLSKDVNITDIVAGHQHGNSFTFNYQNIRLTSALKTGECGGYYEDKEIYLKGASTFTIRNDKVNINRVFVPRNTFKM